MKDLPMDGLCSTDPILAILGLATRLLEVLLAGLDLDLTDSCLLE